MLLSFTRLAAVAALTLAVAAPASAATWNAAGDFTAASTANPNGVWSYGWDVADAAGDYTFTAFDEWHPGVTAFGWGATSHNFVGTPGFWMNATGGSYFGIPDGWLALHPAEDQFGFSNDNAAILRFTAPSASSYSVTLQLDTGDSGLTEGWVVVNGQFASPLATLGTIGTPGVTWNGVVALAAGGTIDVVIGNSVDNLWADNTAVMLTVQSAVPEPAAWLAMLGGLALLGTAARRRARGG